MKNKKDPSSPPQGGPITMGTLNDGTVVIQFRELIKEILFTPGQAIDFGVGLIKNGTRGESLQRVSPPGKTAVGPRRAQ